MKSAYLGKRTFDWLLLAFACFPAVMASAACAIAVRLTSPGPILFKQERIGLNGQPFTMLKFRTMIHGDNPLLPSRDRITQVGVWLRRTSLDELPQLWNVMKGDMSFVGPRPTLAYQVNRYDDRQRRRLTVRPGLTGLAQVMGRNTLSWSTRIDYDLEYIAGQGWPLDLRILLLTLGAVVGGGGVTGHPTDDPLATRE
jgi:lipopolysaccharide/colanic/teichoic acid biosynthesis glycosyltransferase